MMTLDAFRKEITEGIPTIIPETQEYDATINHAPKRKEVLSTEEKKLALKNALRYFPKEQHRILAPEFAQEMIEYGRIYMLRYKPKHEMYARKIEDYPGKCLQAKAIMLMIQNNLDHAVAQHPDELITYGGNGAVFQNWAQYRLCMRYL
jgi:urocanate hydratase